MMAFELALSPIRSRSGSVSSEGNVILSQSTPLDEPLDLAILEYLNRRGLDVLSDRLQLAMGLQGKRIPQSNILKLKWQATTRLNLKVVELEKSMREMSDKIRLYESDGKIKTGAQDGYPAHPAKYTLTGHRKAVTAAVFHPTVFLLLTASEDGNIMIWDFEAGCVDGVLKGHMSGINDLCTDSTGKLIASCSQDSSVKIWNFERREVTKTFNGHDSGVSAVCFVAGGGAGEALLSASRDGTIRQWDVENGFCLRTYSGHHAGWIRTLSVNPDCRRMFASGGNDHRILLWRTDFAEPIDVISDEHDADGHTHVVTNVLFATRKMLKYILDSTKKHFALTRVSHHMTAGSPHETESESEDNPMEYQRQSSYELRRVNYAVLFSAGRDNLIKMWDVYGQCLIHDMKGHENWVQKLECHPDGKFVLSCSDDKTIRVWDVLTADCVSKISNAHSSFLTTLAFCHRTKILATGATDATVKIWQCSSHGDVTDGQVDISRAVSAPSTGLPLASLPLPPPSAWAMSQLGAKPVLPVPKVLLKTPRSPALSAGSASTSSASTGGADGRYAQRATSTATADSVLDMPEASSPSAPPSAEPIATGLDDQTKLIADMSGRNDEELKGSEGQEKLNSDPPSSVVDVGSKDGDNLMEVEAGSDENLEVVNPGEMALDDDDDDDCNEEDFIAIDERDLVDAQGNQVKSAKEEEKTASVSPTDNGDITQKDPAERQSSIASLASQSSLTKPAENSRPSAQSSTKPRSAVAKSTTTRPTGTTRGTPNPTTSGARTAAATTKAATSKATSSATTPGSTASRFARK